jgi:4-hydroxybenzoate polyprenyltransferase
MLAKTKVFLEMIKFEHTIFALPFAYVGALLASLMQMNSLPTVAKTIWITLAMVGARTAAMALNRLIDKTIDLKNPRTSMRALPAKLISQRSVLVFIVLSLALLLVAAAQLHPICLYLSPVALFFLITYSYTKRFTWLCHYFLGITIALAPLGGWVALSGDAPWQAYLLFIAVALWIAGFDIFYACQDAEFDRKEGLFSIPSRFGMQTSFWIARITHILSFTCLLLLYFFSPLSWIYLIGLLIAAVLLVYEHSIISPNDLSRLNQAFFMMNGMLSITVFVCTLLDVVILHEF